MNLESRLGEIIISECDKWIEKYHKYHNSLNVEYQRSKELLNVVPAIDVKQPIYWGIDRKHNPFYVKRNAKAIAKSIAKKIISNLYEPNPPYINKIPKKGGAQGYLGLPNTR